ncbi:hypothetical protein DENSPDRAFT_753048, partial [Dentipellis sp. KUC8613]
RQAAERSQAQARMHTLKKQKELTPDIDNFINSATRPHNCFRAPIAAFFEQDRARSSHLRCRPDLPVGCARCHIIPSPICCSLCSPRSFEGFAHVGPPTTTKSPQVSRSRKIETTYSMTGEEKSLIQDLHAFRKRRTAEKFGQAQLQDMGPSAFMPHGILKRIVDCARVQKLQSREQLWKETQWRASEDDQAAVVAMVSRVFPPPRLMTLSPLIRTPLVQRRAQPDGSGNGQSLGVTPTRETPTTTRRCSKCKQTGHN